MAPSSIFDPGDTPASAASGAYELGMRFQTAFAGQITALRYYRSTQAAVAEESITLNLWTQSGDHLAAVTITAPQGAAGWQQGVLSAPVLAAAGDKFIVSYGTVGAWVLTRPYFTTARSSADGALLAPASTASEPNGVYGATPGTFPALHHQQTNYFVDIAFQVSGGVSVGGSTASGAGAAVREAQGVSDTTSAGRGAGRALAVGIGAADGAGTALGAGSAIATAAGSSVTSSAAQATGVSATALAARTFNAAITGIWQRPIAVNGFWRDVV